jgi:hypothetical protein
VVEFRLYRAAFLPALAALVALLFSLQGVPEALSPSGTPINFDGATAAKAARQIAGAEPDRTPGSSGEAAVADLVEKRFAAIRAGEVSEQTYDSSFDGDDVQLRNVLLTLPGESDRIIAVIAARDSARGPGATSSAAATATLLELARDLGSSTHSKTPRREPDRRRDRDLTARGEHAARCRRGGDLDRRGERLDPARPNRGASRLRTGAAPGRGRGRLR